MCASYIIMANGAGVEALVLLQIIGIKIIAIRLDP